VRAAGAARRAASHSAPSETHRRDAAVLRQAGRLDARRGAPGMCARSRPAAPSPRR
jgi:hypothetical protein